MTGIRRCFLIVCWIFWMSGSSVQAATLIISGVQLNVRSGPGRTYDVIDVVRQHEKFEILEEQDGWYKISVEGRPGWVSAKGVSLASTENLEELLQRADQYFTRQQFTTPPDANAFDLYQEVLRHDPDNAHAQKKITQMAQTYKIWAENASQRGDYEKASIFYQRYLFLVPDDPQIRAALDEIKDSVFRSEASLTISRLRADPTAISKEELHQMIRKFQFSHPADWSKYGLSSSITGNFQHDYERQTSHDVTLVVDYVTNLIWQQTGSPKPLAWKAAHEYIQRLNSMQYAGYADWRLPTIEELASLLSSAKQHGPLYIAPLFDNTQLWCWSADIVESSPDMAWYISFSSGGIQPHERKNSAFVRAVRSMQ